jgi:uncharacterized secreted repeat protein (TIGR03808 family)
MGVGRRQMMLGTFGVGVAIAAGPGTARARATEAPQAFSTFGIVPGGGGIDQTATLQEAADAAAQSGTPLFRPAGIYSSRLTLKSGTHIQGVPGKSILRYRDGSTLMQIEEAQDVRLTGLILDGGCKPLPQGGSLLSGVAVEHLEVSNCRFFGSTEDGVVLRRVSGRIGDCEIGDIRKGGLFSEDASGLEISHNHVRDCGDNGIQVWRSEARTAPSSWPIVSSALPPRAAAAARTAMASIYFGLGRCW